MALSTPKIYYNNGSGNTNLNPGVQAIVVANTLLTVGLQSTSGVVSVTYQIRGPGTIYWGSEQTIYANQGTLNLSWSFVLPSTPTIYVLTTIVSDGQNTTSNTNSFLAQGSLSGTVPAGTGLFHITSGSADTNAYKGTANQLLATNAGDTDTVWTTVAQDATVAVSGTSLNVTVQGIQTIPVSNVAPTTSTPVLVYNGTSYVPSQINISNASQVTGSVSVSSGGTGANTFAAHAVLVGEGTSPIVAVGPGSSGLPLIGGGSSADPSFTALNIAGSGITGTLAVAHGGLNLTTTPGASYVYSDGITSANNATDGAYTVGTPYILTHQTSVGSHPIFIVNGVQKSVTQTGSVSTETSASVGSVVFGRADVSSGNYFSGSYYELLVWDRLLLSEEIGVVLGYLSARYGITV